MSNVSTKYSATASQNVKLGSLSLKENETRYRDLNDLFRQLMADAKVESNEVRALISSASSSAAAAASNATTARSEISGINSRISGIQTQVTAATTTASEARTAAQNAASSASSAAVQATQAAASLASLDTAVDSLQSSTLSLANRVETLESASAEASGTAVVDSATIKYIQGSLSAIDVAIGEDRTDLASDRGQIGRTKAKTGINLNSLVADGWYAIGGTGVSNMPAGVTSGVCHVSSAYAEGSIVQCLWTGTTDTCRAFIRFGNGTNWSVWLEQMLISSLGNGFSVVNGVASVDFSNVLPEVTEADDGKVLSSAGTWVSRVTQEELSAVAGNVTQLVNIIADLRTDLEAVQAQAAVPPDGTTVVEVDGALTVPVYFGATSQDDGTAGLVPAAESSDEGKYLRSDGTWADPAMETATFDGSDVGLVPAPEEGEEGLFLRADGQWADPCEELAERVSAIEAYDPTGYGDRIHALEQSETAEAIDAIFEEGDD